MFEIPSKIEYVLNALSYNGFEGYIVGGCVRDLLMGKVPHDYDITTNALPEDITAIFERTVPTGIEHGTVTVIIENEPIEVTTYRTEKGYSDHRRPDGVTFVPSLEEDLKRRDFTVNALAYNPKSGLIDLFGGINDIECKILRTVGNPRLRFKEDALRILRLFRFSSALGFEIEQNTLASALELSEDLKYISRERISAELLRAILGESPEALAPIIAKGSLSFLGIARAPDFRLLEKCRPNPYLCLFAFIYLTGSPLTETLNRLKQSNKVKKYCETLSWLLGENFPETKPKIKTLLKNCDIGVFRDFLYFAEKVLDKDTSLCSKLLDEIIENKEPYLISHLKIDGEYLKAMGFKGAEIGQILNRLLSYVTETPKLNNRKALKNLINE